MNGIFKGDSIYKSGGGVGGYKDGGQLVDGDFIKVENNTISSYNNVSRDPVNFYFEVADGEVLNGVVELTTAVNATINVYVVKNGFYYLLGNIGGNTVNAGDNYNLSVVGNSFILEVVTPTQAEPEFFELEGVNYELIKLNGLLWTTKNLELNYGTYVVRDGFYYYPPQKTSEINSFLQSKNNRIRLAKRSEFVSLISYLGGGSSAAAALKSTTGWTAERVGNNSSGFNAKGTGHYNTNISSVTQKNTEGWILGLDGYLQLASSAATGSNMNIPYYEGCRFVVEL